MFHGSVNQASSNVSKSRYLLILQQCARLKLVRSNTGKFQGLPDGRRRGQSLDEGNGDEQAAELEAHDHPVALQPTSERPSVDAGLTGKSATLAVVAGVFGSMMAPAMTVTIAWRARFSARNDRFSTF